MARIISSVRLRQWGASARQLEWLAAKGRVLCSATSQNPRSDRWLTSTIMCSRSISAKKARPVSVRPWSASGGQGQTKGAFSFTLEAASSLS